MQFKNIILNLKKSMSPYVVVLSPDDLVQWSYRKRYRTVNDDKYNFEEIFNEMYFKGNYKTRKYIYNLGWKDNIGWRNNIKIRSIHSTPKEHLEIAKLRTINIYKYLLILLDKSKKYRKLKITTHHPKRLKEVYDTIYLKYGYNKLLKQTFNPSDINRLTDEYEYLKSFIEEFMQIIGYKYKDIKTNNKQNFDKGMNDLSKKEFITEVNTYIDIKHKKSLDLFKMLNNLIKREKDKNLSI